MLLIDDPSSPSDCADRALLVAARRLPAEVEALLAPAHARVQAAVSRARRELADAGGIAGFTRCLAEGHRWVADWLDRLADCWEVSDPEDAQFVDRVLRGLADANRQYSAELEDGSLMPADPASQAVACERLAAQLQVSVGSFERKAYADLSHEPNKAMNLNVYLSLLGTTVVEDHEGDEPRLRLARPGETGTSIGDASFVLTLDADSVLLPGYSLRLLHYLTDAGKERVAVAQTPYSAIPGAPSAIERTAGATTDIQHVIHQGFTRYGATFWVGANAVLRMRALRAIAVPEPGSDPPVARFIQDRTVIEDTESSIDLRAAGWQLYNYPQRLAYSATPPDFGSLLIQRRRWANGGLLILPKLLRQLRSSRQSLPATAAEGFLRLHYLTSIAWVNAALVLVFVLPYQPTTPVLWLAAGSVPYFGLYASDLRRSGYRLTDLFDVYALNLLLVPVNLGGVAKSIHQCATGRRTSFARTPKVDARTQSPPLYVVLQLGAAGYLGFAATFDLLTHKWLHAAVGLINLGFLSYGMARMIGRTAIQDSLGPASSALLRRVGRSDDPAAPDGQTWELRRATDNA